MKATWVIISSDTEMSFDSEDSEINSLDTRYLLVIESQTDPHVCGSKSKKFCAVILKKMWRFYLAQKRFWC